jgi:hypothetical protein
MTDRRFQATHHEKALVCRMQSLKLALKVAAVTCTNWLDAEVGFHKAGL